MCHKETHTTKHLLYDCENLDDIWYKVEKVVRMKITYKLLILGSQNDHQLNQIISLLCYIIYKYYICVRNGNHLQKLSLFCKQEILARLSWYSNKVCNVNTNVILNDITNVL